MRLAEAVGRDEVRRAAVDLGVTGELEEGPSMSLGTSGISLIEMVAAYAAVASGRYPVRRRGLPESMGEEESSALPKQVRRELQELLWAAANEGTGRAAILPTQTFGKTGTSQDGRDAYFIGFAGDLVTGVWIGHDDNRPMPGVEGGGLPAVIWRNFMSKALDSSSRSPSPGPAPQEIPPAQGGGEADPLVLREYDVEESFPAGSGTGPGALPDEDSDPAYAPMGWPGTGDGTGPAAPLNQEDGTSGPVAPPRNEPNVIDTGPAGAPEPIGDPPEPDSKPSDEQGDGGQTFRPPADEMQE